jgi:hypothetical protein
MLESAANVSEYEDGNTVLTLRVAGVNVYKDFFKKP